MRHVISKPIVTTITAGVVALAIVILTVVLFPTTAWAGEPGDELRILRAENKILTRAAATQTVKIKALQKEIAALKAEIERLKKSNPASSKTAIPSTESKAKRYQAYMKQTHQKRIADAKQAIVKAENELQDICRTGGSPGRTLDEMQLTRAERTRRRQQKKRQELGQLHKKLAELKKAGPTVEPTLDPTNMKLGDMGYIKYYKDRASNKEIFVQQVIGPEDMLIKVDRWRVQPGRTRRVGESYYTGPSHTVKTYSPDIWVHGVSTVGITDRMHIALEQVFEVTGTKTYKTITGSNTVFVIEPLDFP